MTRREPGLIGLFIVPGHRNKVITDYLPIHLDRLNTKDAEKALGIIRKQARALRHCVDGDDGDFYKLTDKELLESILHMTAVEHYRTGEKTSAAIYTYACALHHACLYGYLISNLQSDEPAIFQRLEHIRTFEQARDNYQFLITLMHERFAWDYQGWDPHAEA